MNRYFIIPVILLNLLFVEARANDVKVKLTDAAGAKSFEIRDSADVVVSSITSDGVSTVEYLTVNSSVSVAGNLDVMGAFSGNMVSSATYNATWSDSSVNDTWQIVPDVNVTINMEKAGIIFGFFCCNAKDNDAGFIQYSFYLDDSTTFGVAGIDSHATATKNITCIGTIAAGAGSHTVKIRRSGDSTADNKVGSQFHSLTVFAWSVQ